MLKPVGEWAMVMTVSDEPVDEWMGERNEPLLVCGSKLWIQNKVTLFTKLLIIFQINLSMVQCVFWF